jgi:hypothetical protein
MLLRAASASRPHVHRRSEGRIDCPGLHCVVDWSLSDESKRDHYYARYVTAWIRVVPGPSIPRPFTYLLVRFEARTPPELTKLRNATAQGGR